MSYFQDFVDAVEAYPGDYLTIQIVDVNIPGTALNAAEVGTFKVQVSNSGPLHVTDVKFRVTGLHGSQVHDSGAATPWTTEFVTAGSIDKVFAHQGQNFAVLGGSALQFKAPSAAHPSQSLVKVALEDWNCNLLHPLDDHSDPNAAVKATYATEVFPV